MTATPEISQRMDDWDVGVWCLAAVALSTSRAGSPAVVAAAEQVLVSAGLLDGAQGGLRGIDPATAPLVGNQAAASLHQTSTLLRGTGAAWSDQSDAALLAQGRASAQGARPFVQFLLPQMGDLADRLSSSSARMLDVGTGVGALAVSYAEALPALHVVGIDVLDRALELARETIAASPVADRVSVRRQDVADVADDEGFDLAWLPAPFVPEPALLRGLPRIIETLRPGGWMMVGHGKRTGDPVRDSLTRLKTLAYGGTPLDDAAARRLLEEHGLTSVTTAPTPPGSPGITIGCRPAEPPR